MFFLLCVAPHPVLGFLTGRCPVGFAGRTHHTVDDLEAAQRRTIDVRNRTRPPDAGTHRDPSNVVSPATAGKMTVATCDSGAHNLWKVKTQLRHMTGVTGLGR